MTPFVYQHLVARFLKHQHDIQVVFRRTNQAPIEMVCLKNQCEFDPKFLVHWYIVLMFQKSSHKMLVHKWGHYDKLLKIVFWIVKNSKVSPKPLSEPKLQILVMVMKKD